MGIVRDVAIDFVLFRLWEGIYFYLFARNYSGIKLKIYQVLIMILINSIIGTVFPPTIKQIVFIIFMTTYYYVFGHVKLYKSFKTVFVSFIIFFTIEVLYSIFIEYFVNVEMLVLNLKVNEKFVIFLYLVPIRIVEYLIAFKKKRGASL